MAERRSVELKVFWQSPPGPTALWTPLYASERLLLLTGGHFAFLPRQDKLAALIYGALFAGAGLAAR